MLAALLGAATGCLPDAPGFACGADGVTPRCTTPGSECRAGFCAVRAADCASGWRFTESAATPGVCVPPSAVDAGGDVQAVDDGSADDRPLLDDVPPDAGLDAPTVDLGVDAGGGADVVPDLGVIDAGADVVDAGAAVDVGVDARVDVAVDVAQTDTGVDAGRPDVGVDAGRLDAGVDAGPGDVPAVDVSPCQPGETLCAGRCHTLSNSVEHCGACGNRCPLGEVCSGGACACGAGQARCGGVCATAGACTSMGSGGCAQTGTWRCVNGTMTCDAVPRTSGACSVPSGGQCSTGGVCQCPSGRAACGGACRDIQTDAEHCGRCGNACGNNQVCSQGLCVLGCVVEDGTPSSRHVAPRCLQSSVCPVGLVCTGVLGVCLPQPCNMSTICIGTASCRPVTLRVTCGPETEVITHARCQRDGDV
jgi:hypothetical protein